MEIYISKIWAVTSLIGAYWKMLFMVENLLVRWAIKIVGCLVAGQRTRRPGSICYIKRRGKTSVYQFLLRSGPISFPDFMSDDYSQSFYWRKLYSAIYSTTTSRTWIESSTRQPAAITSTTIVSQTTTTYMPSLNYDDFAMNTTFNLPANDSTAEVSAQVSPLNIVKVRKLSN